VFSLKGGENGIARLVSIKKAGIRPFLGWGAALPNRALYLEQGLFVTQQTQIETALT
jgi:hypothetical protein